MTLCEITKTLEENAKTDEDKIRILRKIRAQLLEEVHVKQQLLDQIDYMIYEIKCSCSGRT